MQIRVITMRYSEGLQGFSEDALRGATFGRDVLAMEQHFFLHGNVPHLALILSLAGSDAGGGGRFGEGSGAKVDYEAELPEEVRPVYLALKDWRNKMAKARKCPAFAIARNWQLSQLVRKAPKTLAGIKEIEGFGESFCKMYGDDILKMLADVAPTPCEAPAASTPPDSPPPDATPDTPKEVAAK